MNDLGNYPFLDLGNLKSDYLKGKSIIGTEFKKIVVIGVGGSSQGSKAINNFLNEKRVIYFDHLNQDLINETLEEAEVDRTGFIFISKSGTTSEILTIFDYLVSQLENKINISNHFFALTELKSSPLHDLSIHHSIKIIEHNNCGLVSSAENVTQFQNMILKASKLHKSGKLKSLGDNSYKLYKNRYITMRFY